MAKRRRGRGEGTIFQRQNGQWTAVITVGRSAEGRRIRRTVYGKTRAEVQEKLIRLHCYRVEGTLSGVNRMTLAEFLSQWLENSARLQVAPTTYARYCGLIQKHVSPRIGGLRLTSIGPAQVQALLSGLEREGASTPTRFYVYSVLRRAFNVGVRWGILPKNPCQQVESPKPKYRGITPLNPEAAQRLLELSRETRYEALFVLAITSGLRQGELFGLQWENVDLERGMIAVRNTLEEVKGKIRLKEPKSASGRRAVKLPQLAVEALLTHRKRSLAEGFGGVPWVFCDSRGNPLRKSNFERRVWKPLRQKAALGTVRFHDLRHTSASLLLLAGVHPKVVQERLGHAQISLTLDTYSHLLPGMQEAAADKLDQMLSLATG